MLRKFFIDNNNRLIIIQDEEALQPKGTFTIDEANRLVYCLNETIEWRKRYKFPEKIVLTGNWSLNPNYDLEFICHSRASGDPDNSILELKGEIILCESNKLIFEIKTVDKNGLAHFRLLKLSGIWQADDFNQIFFAVSKKEFPDLLTFQGAWKLNQNQQITYTYEKAERKTKARNSYALVFSGFWQITSANKLTYILSQSTNSRFDFKAQIETPNIYPKKGVIRYRVGAGVREPQAGRFKIISLYGTWKFSRKLGLTFEMEYIKGQINSISFGAEVNFDKRNRVIFNLTNRERKDLGISLLFTHRFLKQLDADFFLRLKRYQAESGVETGIRIPF